jgi:hypothetical protein
VEERTTEPQRVVISGLVEELKISKAKVTFIPERGQQFTGFLGEGIAAVDMAKQWGQKAHIGVVIGQFFVPCSCVVLTR